MPTINSDNTTRSTSTGSTSRFSDLSSEQFVKIMFSELTRQDPLKPNDSNALLQQLNSIRSIEANITLERKLGDLVAQNQMSTAGGLVGAFVSGITDTNQRVEGQVISVSQTPGGPVMNLREGWRVPFRNVDEFFLPDLANPQIPNPAPPLTPPPVSGSPLVNDRNANSLSDLLAGLGGTVAPALPTSGSSTITAPVSTIVSPNAVRVAPVAPTPAGT